MKYTIGFLFGTLITIGLCIYYASDAVYCVISGAGNSQVNGYYSAKEGYYQKHGEKLSSAPDVFSYFHDKYTSSTNSYEFILFTKGFWLMSVANSNGKVDSVYINDCGKSTIAESALCVKRPPSTGWEKATSSAQLPIPTVSSQHGDLVDSFSSSGSGENSNLGKLWNQPVTTMLLMVIFIVAYYLWANRIDVGLISYSYDAVIHRGEYWRIITASMSHVDVLHLLFNTMALYQLGSLESIYGSFTYAYLSFALVFLTILICIAIDYILIYRYQRTEQQYVQAIGYSCVLFAWLVAMSVRMPKFCPIFIFPSLCVSTWTIPYPSFLQSWTGMEGLPINLGPFLLLFFTKLIIPRSSFFGHLAGILIGYPLAWNMLNFMTIPWTCAMLLVLWILLKKQFMWTFPSVEMSFTSLSEFLPQSTLMIYYGFVICSLGVVVSYFVLLAFVNWWEQMLIRLVAIFVFISSIWAKKIEFHAFSSGVQQDTGRFLWFTWLYLLVLWVYDVWNTIVYYQGAVLLLGNGLLIQDLSRLQILSLTITFVELLLIVLLFRLLQLTGSCQDTLKCFRLDGASVAEDVSPVYDRCCKSATVAFSGRSFRASSSGHDTSSATTTTTATAAGDVENPLAIGMVRLGSEPAHHYSHHNHLTHARPGFLSSIAAGNNVVATEETAEEGHFVGSGQGYDRLPQSSDDQEHVPGPSHLVKDSEKMKIAKQNLI